MADDAVVLERLVAVALDVGRARVGGESHFDAAVLRAQADLLASRGSAVTADGGPAEGARGVVEDEEFAVWGRLRMVYVDFGDEFVVVVDRERARKATQALYSSGHLLHRYDGGSEDVTRYLTRSFVPLGAASSQAVTDLREDWAVRMAPSPKLYAQRQRKKLAT